MKSTDGQVGADCLRDIVVYPVKGLSGQLLDRVHVTPKGIPFDRLLALAPRDSGAAKSNGAGLTRESFFDLYSLDVHARLAGLSTELEPTSGRLVIRVQRHVLLDCDLRTPTGVEAATSLLGRVLDLDPWDRPELLRAPADHNYGWPGLQNSADVWACHVVNLASVRDLESRIGQRLDPRRFRANLYLDLEEPWVERRWMARVFAIGSVPLQCVQPATRCATTEINPDTARLDVPVPRLLMQHYGHTELGIYANILGEGALERGMTVTSPAPPPVTPQASERR